MMKMSYRLNLSCLNLSCLSLNLYLTFPVLGFRLLERLRLRSGSGFSRPTVMGRPSGLTAPSRPSSPPCRSRMTLEAAMGRRWQYSSSARSWSSHPQQTEETLLKPQPKPWTAEWISDSISTSISTESELRNSKTAPQRCPSSKTWPTR